MTTRPVIGVSSYDTPATWGPWHGDATLIHRAYLDALVAAGAAPVVLPLDTDVESVISRLDGVVLIGGFDVDPARYGQTAASTATTASAERDAFEFELAAATLEGGLPLFAICRGLQVLNVLRGGTLIQHLPAVIGNTNHAPAPGTFGSTTVEVERSTRLAEILGRQEVVVSCSHHQAIDKVGDRLTVSARAKDGTIEAVEDPAAAFVVAVQWHPEVDRDPALFEGFMAACVARLGHRPTSSAEPGLTATG